MYHGVIPIFKEAGMTSHDVVFKARKILGMKKIGHTGTLDPDVTGVLPLVAGQATKLTEYMQQRDKRYTAEVTLGVSTDTEDASGEITDQQPVPVIDTAVIDEAVNSFIGEYYQKVPKYSSVKVNGRKLYEYARAGIEVERPVKTVFIKDIDRISDIKYDGQTITFEIDVICSKGTYIRTLAVDIGKKLSVPSHMSHLVRTESCGFNINQTVTLQELSKINPETVIQPVENIIIENTEIYIENSDLLFKIKNGQKVYKDDMIKYVNGSGNINDKFIVFKYNGFVLAVYETHPEKHEILKPFKMFKSDI